MRKRDMEEEEKPEEVKKKNSLAERKLKPYLGCLTSGELDLEREGKEKRKKEKRRVI